MGHSAGIAGENEGLFEHNVLQSVRLFGYKQQGGCFLKEMDTDRLEG